MHCYKKGPNNLFSHKVLHEINGRPNAIDGNKVEKKGRKIKTRSWSLKFFSQKKFSNINSYYIDTLNICDP